MGGDPATYVEVPERNESLRSIGLLRGAEASQEAAGRGGIGEGVFLKRVVGPMCDEATSLLAAFRGLGAISGMAKVEVERWEGAEDPMMERTGGVVVLADEERRTGGRGTWSDLIEGGREETRDGLECFSLVAGRGGRGGEAMAFQFDVEAGCEGEAEVVEGGGEAGRAYGPGTSAC